MMDGGAAMFINAAWSAGLVVLLGGPLFYLLVLRPACGDGDAGAAGLLLRRTAWFTVAGGILFLAAALVKAVHAPAVAGGVDSGTLVAGSRRVWYLAQALLAPVFTAYFLVAAGRASRSLAAGTTVLALLLAGLAAATGHAAADPGLLAPASSVVHLLAAALGGGGLLLLPLLPWSLLRHDGEHHALLFRRIAERFTNLALVALGMAILTGALLAFIHVHSNAALDTTRYGEILKVKLLLVALLVFLLVLKLVRVVPALERNSAAPQAGDTAGPLRRYRRLVQVEAAAVAALVIVSGVMASRAPPDNAPFLTPRSWTMQAGKDPVRVNWQPVAGQASHVRFEITAAGGGIPSGTGVTFNLFMPGGEAGVFGAVADQVSADSFLGEATVAMPGRWRFELTLHPPGQDSVTGTRELDIRGQPLQDDLRSYLSLAAVSFNSARTITFLVGLLLALTAGWLVAQSRAGRAPLWVFPVSLGSLALGVYLALSVSLVKTYPSTFWKNPQPYTAAVISRGRAGFQARCARCHGDRGQGDGPWALQERGKPIPDLSAPHLDVHTDGEIYWWITRGIPSLGMPVLAEELAEQERWAVINYVRSLRHGVPGNQ